MCTKSIFFPLFVLTLESVKTGLELIMPESVRIKPTLASFS